jgi:hypothetical protein
MKAIRVEKQGGPEVLKLMDVAPLDTGRIYIRGRRGVPVAGHDGTLPDPRIPAACSRQLRTDSRGCGRDGRALGAVGQDLGANVIGTVSTGAKARTARTSGADHIIVYTEQDFVAETKQITNARGAD